MLGLLVAALAASLAPSSSAQEAAKGGRPVPLQLDLERHVAEAVDRHRRADVPEFAVEVVEYWPQSFLENHFRGVDLECQPSKASPPSTMEMRPHMGAGPIPFHADFLGALKALVRLFRSGGPPRYFLYLVHREGRVAYALNEGPASDAARLGTPGMTWELIAAFADLKRGTAALRRLERGSPKAERTRDDERLPPWVQTTCRPPGFD